MIHGLFRKMTGYCVNKNNACKEKGMRDSGISVGDYGNKPDER